MRERFTIEHQKAASSTEAAFILDHKSGLEVKIVAFTTLKDLDAYRTGNATLPVRNLPILLEAKDNDLTERNLTGVMKRMADWYYYTVLNAPNQ